MFDLFAAFLCKISFYGNKTLTNTSAPCIQITFFILKLYLVIHEIILSFPIEPVFTVHPVHIVRNCPHFLLILISTFLIECACKAYHKF